MGSNIFTVGSCFLKFILYCYENIMLAYSNVEYTLGYHSDESSHYSYGISW